jgi:hypothetical protein
VACGRPLATARTIAVRAALRAGVRRPPEVVLSWEVSFGFV